MSEFPTSVGMNRLMFLNIKIYYGFLTSEGMNRYTIRMF
ncbi:hypothetical protein Mpal_1599 [Methanosphaerula palustris E1-9c]|uniref:Uncharacterized protein n=1 Tax=Methanosphaerula palustris (strain ATCC BAA-1556 / DSM 19958 / E1-9c) TaxID=521011 RepID=B8GIU8_METPE|nr:hypothetical protein Mpal_1599 [Methanosphaerula palustris E1-9c]